VQTRNYQRTLALDPGGPGAKVSSPGTVSPGTAAVPCELDSSVVASSREAQADIRNAIAKNKAAHSPKRFITGQT